MKVGNAKIEMFFVSSRQKYFACLLIIAIIPSFLHSVETILHSISVKTVPKMTLNASSGTLSPCLLLTHSIMLSVMTDF